MQSGDFIPLRSKNDILCFKRRFKNEELILAFNITPEPTVLEVVAWLAYGIPVLVLFLWPVRKSAKKPSGAPAPSTAPAGTKPAETEPAPAPQA